MRAQISTRRVLATVRTDTVYRQDAVARNLDVPTDELVRNW